MTTQAIAAGTRPRLLEGASAGRVSLAEHQAIHGRPSTAASFLEQVERSGLRGRGGAAFPFSVKLASVASRRRRPIVVVNASEGEPLSGKDQLLLSAVPHLVLEGALACADSVRAKEIVVAVRRRSPAALASLTQAIDERSRARVAHTPIRVVEVPDRYVSGEASALVSLLNGGPAIPSGPSPRPDERGVARRPTLLSNAETYAHLGLIACRGAQWFREVGAEQDPGTRLLTVIPPRGASQVIEAATDATVAEVIPDAWLAGCDVALVGGYAGTWVRTDHLRSLVLASPPPRMPGTSLGVGLIALLPREACVLAETAAIADWMAGESARQCGPCLNGLPAIAAELEALAAGKAADIERIKRWCGMVDGRGLCHHPGGVARTVRSALSIAVDDADAHARGVACNGARSIRAIPIPLPVSGPDEEWR